MVRQRRTVDGIHTDVNWLHRRIQTTIPTYVVDNSCERAGGRTCAFIVRGAQQRASQSTTTDTWHRVMTRTDTAHAVECDVHWRHGCLDSVEAEGSLIKSSRDRIWVISRYILTQVRYVL